MLDKNVMIQSYSGISFYGERRGAQDFQDYTEMLENDLKELGENRGNYKEKFISKLMRCYHAQSSCTSAFIVGPANYNVRRHNKKWASRDKAWQDFWQWRERYFKAVNRVRTPSPEDEIENAIKDIDKYLVQQAKMKETNKIIRKYRLYSAIENNEKQTPPILKDLTSKHREGLRELLNLWSKKSVRLILTKNCFNVIGFEGFELTSINNKIKARRQKIEIMKVRIERKETFKPIEFNGGSIYIENDRVIIDHDSKPEKEIIQAIKSNGFRWSPKFKNWCRKHTGNAIRDAEYLLNNHFGGKI